MEQMLRVAATDLQTVRFAERCTIEPLSCDTDVLEGKVNGIQNAIGADLKHDFCQSLRSKISTGRDVEILAQVFADRMFCFRTNSQGFLKCDCQCAKYCMAGLLRDAR